ncbi:Uncharacterised protein [Vibrio cholerae]|nr:Uncharacterised protein [Vibrio cholerae]CSB97735.1 Uncharacterised protein [Vibrio cholerae]CSB99060.1 Uncharacterised protein [Vibrio cholerae]CSD15875.1 Uncharacterised protein [Vibrio cholerae]CSI31267.1 Uncharacterised protein [Vibrio cholerae]
MDFITATLRFKHHGKAGIFFDVNGRDRVHHNTEFNHGLSPFSQDRRNELVVQLSP